MPLGKSRHGRLERALFAFHAHTNARIGRCPLLSQYPVVPSSATIQREAVLSNIQLEDARITRKTYVQNLQKYRTDAAEKFRTGLERITVMRDDCFKEPIIPGDLVMRKVPQESKTHTYQMGWSICFPCID